MRCDDDVLYCGDHLRCERAPTVFGRAPSSSRGYGCDSACAGVAGRCCGHRRAARWTSASIHTDRSTTVGAGRSRPEAATRWPGGGYYGIFPQCVVRLSVVSGGGYYGTELSMQHAVLRVYCRVGAHRGPVRPGGERRRGLFSADDCTLQCDLFNIKLSVKQNARRSL